MKFEYDPKLFALIQLALFEISKQKPKDPIKFMANFILQHKH
ncbi:hypothetical protein pb186bvf_017710 [Paramecium bursaria]